MLGKFLFAFFIIFGYTHNTTVHADNGAVVASSPDCQEISIPLDASQCDLSEEDDEDLLRALEASPEPLDTSWLNQARTLLAIAKAQSLQLWEAHRTKIIFGVAAAILVAVVIYRSRQG